MRYLIGYDIPDDRRRRRVARLLEGYGERLHESAFVARLRPGQYGALQRRLQALVHAEQDRLRVYPMCDRDAPDRRHVIGDTPLDPPTHHVV